VIRLAVRVARDQAEMVLAELLELAPAGVEERDIDGDAVEFAVYGAPGELPALPDLNAAAGEALVSISTSEIPDGWDERWKRFHRPVLIEAPAVHSAGGRVLPALRVRPPWEEPQAGNGSEVEEIVIDPGQAFGTGSHATTRMCLELLLQVAAVMRAPGPLLDIGTGSGVLAVAGSRLGFRPVLALDHERESVQAARENAAVNRVQIEARRFDLREEPLPWLGPGETPPGGLVVVANLLRPLLLELARTMAAPPLHLVVGGLLRPEAGEIAEAFGERLGLREHARRESGEWASLWLVDGDQARSGISVAARTIER
jgi:ribosomal protein L11 methyltransferase